MSVEGVGFDKDIARSERGVVFTQNVGTDELGDRLLGGYEYVWGSGKANLKKKIPKYSIGPLSQKQYPDDFLSDPIMREPLIKLLGDKYFSTFRLATLGSDKLKIIDDNLVIGSGCQPHDCSDNFAMFIIDVRRKLAWAVKGEEVPVGHRGARIWRVIGNKDELLLTEINHWIIDHEIRMCRCRHLYLSYTRYRVIAMLIITQRQHQRTPVRSQ